MYWEEQTDVKWRSFVCAVMNDEALMWESCLVQQTAHQRFPIAETESVYCAVRTGSLCIIQLYFVL